MNIFSSTICNIVNYYTTGSMSPELLKLIEKKKKNLHNSCPECLSKDIYYDVLVGEYICCSCGVVLRWDEVVVREDVKINEREV